MTMTSARGAAEGLAAGVGAPASRRAGRTSAAEARAQADASGEAGAGLFARSVRDYARQHAGTQIRLLQAGCTGPIDDLGLDDLPAGGPGVSIRGIDQDHPLTRKAADAARGAGVPVVLGDLRTVPLPSREFAIVYCAHLLDRVEHAELVLDRLVAALRPGGLLLLRFRDRECAAGLLDRLLPLAARRAVWHWLRAGQAGPFPAVFGPLLSAAGVEGYVLRRGLVIAERRALRDRPPRPARPAWGAPLACRLLATLSGGRLTDDHDDLLYVIRNPESGFARVL